MFEWDVVLSRAGYVKDGELYLNERILDDPDFSNCNLITIEDEKAKRLYENGEYHLSQYPEQYIKYNSCLNLYNSVRIDDFEIRNNEQLELHILQNHVQAKPRRQAFKLCNIVEREPIEIKFNQKGDSTLTRGRERYFLEEQYIFIYLGTFNSCNILAYPFEPIEKQLPRQTKLIDLLKPLW